MKKYIKWNLYTDTVVQSALYILSSNMSLIFNSQGSFSSQKTGYSSSRLMQEIKGGKGLSTYE